MSDLEFDFSEVNEKTNNEQFEKALREYLEKYFEENGIEGFEDYIVEGRLNVNSMMTGHEVFRESFNAFLKDKRITENDINNDGFDEQPPSFEDHLEDNSFEDGEGLRPPGNSGEEDDSIYPNDDDNEVINNEDSDIKKKAQPVLEDEKGSVPEEMNDNSTAESLREDNEKLKKEIEAEKIKNQEQKVSNEQNQKGSSSGNEESGSGGSIMGSLGAGMGALVGGFKSGRAKSSDRHAEEGGYMKEVDSSNKSKSNILPFVSYAAMAAEMTPEQTMEKLKSIKSSNLEAEIQSLKYNMVAVDQSLNITAMPIGKISTVASLIGGIKTGTPEVKEMSLDRLSLVSGKLEEEGAFIQSAYSQLNEKVEFMITKAKELEWPDSSIRELISDPIEKWNESNKDRVDAVSDGLEALSKRDEEDPAVAKRLKELSEGIRSSARDFVDKIKRLLGIGASKSEGPTRSITK
jgi:hypothetical protein